MQDEAVITAPHDEGAEQIEPIPGQIDIFELISEDA